LQARLKTDREGSTLNISLPINNILEKNYLAVSNTLAYYDTESVIKKKMATFSSGLSSIKNYMPVIVAVS
jgi:hypothetical protein